MVRKKARMIIGRREVFMDLESRRRDEHARKSVSGTKASGQTAVPSVVKFRSRLVLRSGILDLK